MFIDFKISCSHRKACKCYQPWKYKIENPDDIILKVESAGGGKSLESGITAD